jgi:N,N'-diacetyllegionaminate synthase
MKIGKFKINNNFKPYIIAEAGVAHFGKFSWAKKLVDIAKYSGAHAVKFQAYKTDEFISKRFKAWHDRYKSKEITFDFLKKIQLYCKKKNIEFLCTPHSETAIDWLKKLKVPAYKIGSGDLGNFEFLKKIIKINKPIIISTGMHDYKDLMNLKNFLNSQKFNKFIILYCCTIYPAKSNQINLNKITLIKSIFKKKFYGYSDHSNDDLAIIGSVYMGASLIEKHIAVKFNDKNSQDWKVSFNKKDFLKMNKKIENISKLMGKNERYISTKETNQKTWAQKSIYLNKDKYKNQKINLDDLNFMRPGNGIHCSLASKIVGRKLIKNVKINHKIKFSDLKK